MGYVKFQRRREKVLKRLLFVLVLGGLILFVGLILFCGERVCAAAVTAEEEAALTELKKQVAGLLEALDTADLEEYLSTLDHYEQVQLKDVLSRLVTGDLSLDYSSLWEYVLSLIWADGKGMLPAFAVIMASILLCGVLNASGSGFSKSALSSVVYFASYVAIGAVLLSVMLSVLQAGFSAVNEMRRQMEIVYPMLLTLMAASGGAVSAGIYRPAVAFLSSAVCELFTTVILPTSVVVIVLTFIGGLSDEVRTGRLADLFKSVNKWIVGLVLGILGIFLTVQGISSAQYDGISLRTVKYLVSGSVPIVGGFLSGGLDLVLAGSALIKNAVGSFAVFLLFGTVLRPALLFAAFQLFLRLCAAAAEPIGGKISDFLSRLASDCGIFLAGLLCVAFLYFLTLVLLVCSSGVIF